MRVVAEASNGTQHNGYQVTVGGRRNDGAATVLGSLDGDNTSLITDNRGRLYVDGSTVMPADNAAFVDGTTPVQPVGFIYDDVAGTALTENDVAAGRIDSKRAIVIALEGATRGTRSNVLAAVPAITENGLVVRPIPFTLISTDTFTAAGNGAPKTGYCQNYSLSVAQTGVVTSWNVVLEATLDAITYTTVPGCTHTNATGSGVMVTNTATMPSGRFRSRCTAIVLGLGTNIIATPFGMQ